MSGSPPIDQAQAHRFFSADCFNRAWEILGMPQRPTEEEEQMLLLCQASLWHWTQRDDCTERSLSIGHWQLSRVYAALRQAENAVRSAETCLRFSQAQPSFYQAYAHEAIARAAMLGGDSERMARHLAAARSLAAQVTESEERSMLEKDLESIH